MRLLSKLTKAVQEWKQERRHLGFEKSGGRYVRTLLDIAGCAFIPVAGFAVAPVLGFLGVTVACWLTSIAVKKVG